MNMNINFSYDSQYNFLTSEHDDLKLHILMARSFWNRLVSS